MPWSILDRIESQFHTDEERKAELFRVYVEEHPEATWEHVSDALYRYDGGIDECHRTLDIVQSSFPTGGYHFSNALANPYSVVQQ